MISRFAFIRRRRCRIEVFFRTRSIQIGRILGDETDTNGLMDKSRIIGNDTPPMPALALQAWEPRANSQASPAQGQDIAQPVAQFDRWSGPGGQVFLKSLPMPAASVRSLVPWRVVEPSNPRRFGVAHPLVSPLSPNYREELVPSGGLNGFGYRVAPGDVELPARLLFAEAAGVPDAYDDIAWSTIKRIGAPRRGGL
jgi:hypothetical protein